MKTHKIISQEYDSLNIPSSFFTQVSTQPSSVDVRTSEAHDVLLVVWPTGNLHQACLLSIQENIVGCLCLVVADIKIFRNTRSQSKKKSFLIDDGYEYS